MTLPAPDAWSSRHMPRRPHNILPDHSIPAPLLADPPMTSPHSSSSVVKAGEDISREHALDFATHSWDLATGGLKTLTAKRELPVWSGRRSAGVKIDALGASRNYTLILVTMLCVVLLLLGGGIVLLVMLQP